MPGEFITAVKDAFRWESLDAADSRAAVAMDDALVRSRPRLLRASFAGIGVGAVVVVAGYWVGQLIEDWLNAVTDGGWGFFSKWLGDLGLLPFVFCGIGAVTLLLGVYRLLTVLVPSLARDTAAARFVRVSLIAVLGTGLVVAAALLGFVRLDGD